MNNVTRPTELKAVILAAGRGSRLGSLTEKQPKCLLRLDSISLLERQIRAIQSNGISKIAVVTGYKSEALSQFPVTKFHNNNWESSNMVTSLTYAKNWLESSNCIVSYSDIFYESSAISALKKDEEDLTLLYDPNWLQNWSLRFDNPLDDAESFYFRDGLLLEIGKKILNVNEILGQYMGLIKTTPKSWRNIERYLSSLSTHDLNNMQMTELLNNLIKESVQSIHVTPYYGQWGEIDTQKDLNIYESLYFHN